MRSAYIAPLVALGFCAFVSAATRGQPSQSNTTNAAKAPTMAEALQKLQSNDPKGAAVLLEAIVTADATNGQAWRTLGAAYQQSKDADRALAAFLRALELLPETPQLLYNLGSTYAMKKDATRAFDWLAKARATRRVDMTQIEVDPNLASFGADPRLAALRPTPQDFAAPFVEPVTVLREWRGESSHDQFGWIARVIGDVDGDRVPDVVTSAPTKTIGEKNAGRIYAYSTKSSRLLWTVDGRPGNQLGTGVEGAGDVNGDGVPDVIGAAPGGGYAAVYSGLDGRRLLTLSAERREDDFGRHAAGVGDVNHDGAADVIVGAPLSAAGGREAGRAYIYSGRDGRLLLTLTGARPGDKFGSSVAGFSNAKTITIVVGAPGAGAARHGQALVYRSLSPTPSFVIESDDTGVALGAMFVSVLGDVDGDGAPDVYPSDWSNAAKGPSTGRVYVHSGKDGRRLLTLTGETAGEGFGTSPAVAGDVDGDGHADLIVGAWQHASAATSGGRAYLYSGSDGRLIKTFTCRTPGDTFGFDAVSIGDIDADGRVDFLITSGWSGVSGFHSGRVFVVSSGVAKRRGGADREAPLRRDDAVTAA